MDGTGLDIPEETVSKVAVVEYRHDDEVVAERRVATE